MEMQVLKYYIDSNMKTNKISRDVIHIQSVTLWQFAIPTRDSLSYLLFLLFPALLCGCQIMEIETTSEPLSPMAYVTYSKHDTKTRININDDITCLDVFSFNDDVFERLDSYQRFEHVEFKDNTCSIGTSSGKKRIIMLANHTSDKYEWIDINCTKALEKTRFDLEQEEPDYPIMTADFKIDAGESLNSELEPLTGEVLLRSICCDFSGKAYSGSELTDIKVYLTNVNASCGIWNNDDGSPARIINAGRLNGDDLSRFTHPEMIYQDLGNSVGSIRSYPGIKFKAYPSYHQDESIGTPFTRLVIEGKIMGHTYYYPIAINRTAKSDNSGLRRNMCYIYDITIRRTGLTDPDGNIEDSFADIDIEVEKWKERDWYDLHF